MLLSALTFAALLQTAPVVGHKGYLLEQKPYETSQSVDQLRMPFPKTRRPAPPRPPRKLTFAPRPKLSFVRGPQAHCRSAAPQPVGHPETLMVEPLSKMPMARGEWAVAHMVDGCPVAVLIKQDNGAR